MTVEKVAYPRTMVDPQNPSSDRGIADKTKRSRAANGGGEPPVATRQRILEAAIDEFVEAGFAGARIDRIAQASGFNKQLIYRYFGNKKDLYEAAFESLVLRVRGGSPDGEIDGEAVVRGMGVLGAGDERGADTEADESSADLEQVTYMMSRFIVWEAISGQATGADLAAKRAENYRAAIDWVRQQQGQGQIRGDVPAELATALLAVAGGVPYSMPNVLQFVNDQEGLSDSDKKRWREFVWRVLQ